MEILYKIKTETWRHAANEISLRHCPIHTFRLRFVCFVFGFWFLVFGLVSFWCRDPKPIFEQSVESIVSSSVRPLVGLSWVSQVGMPLPIAGQLPLGTWNCQRQLVLNNAGDGGTPKWTGSKKVNLISSVCNNCRSSFVLRLSFSALSLTANSRITIADTETHHRPPPACFAYCFTRLQASEWLLRLIFDAKKISLNNFLRFQVLPASCDRDSLHLSFAPWQDQKLKLWTLMYSDSFSEPWNYILLFLRRKSSSCGKWKEANIVDRKPMETWNFVKSSRKLCVRLVGCHFVNSNLCWQVARIVLCHMQMHTVVGKIIAFWLL